MAKTIIIGGGLAGLSAAVYLSKNNRKVELIESSPKLGGRTYSFFNKTFNSEIDNGQHLLLGAYKSTLEFLKITNAINKIEFQDNLKIIYKNKVGESFTIDASKYFYPINLLSAIWNFNSLTKKDKFNFIRFVSSISFQNDKNLEKISVKKYLIKNNQSENAIKSFWEILAISALNTNIDEASAVLFNKMLKKIFLAGNKSTTILTPKENLSKIFIDPSLEYLKQTSFNYSISEKLESIKIYNNIITELKTDLRTITDFENVILAIPPYQILKLNCNEKLLQSDFLEFEYSAIISVNMKLKKNIFTEKFVALIDSEVDWIFNHNKYISIVISDANKFVELSKEQILEICINELQKYFKNFEKDLIIKSLVIKEKRATIKSTPEFENFRNKIVTKIKNLSIVGDWTNTGLPQTIESAILSGKLSAFKFIK
ncbi:MAG: FAD-dependent oxidoreductase [Ignavibacteriae bacterium]|nr:FAD-dependent oxidoreductase [Ignavibacteriota bacterium]